MSLWSSFKVYIVLISYFWETLYFLDQKLMPAGRRQKVSLLHLENLILFSCFKMTQPQVWAFPFSSIFVWWERVIKHWCLPKVPLSQRSSSFSVNISPHFLCWIWRVVPFNPWLIPSWEKNFLLQAEKMYKMTSISFKMVEVSFCCSACNNSYFLLSLR